MRLFSRLFRKRSSSKDIGSDQYERGARLRKTGMSEVWAATRLRDKARVIVKIARVDQESTKRVNEDALRNEAELLRRFKGESRIIQIYHAATTKLPGSPYFIAAEYLAGGTLNDLLVQKSFWGSAREFGSQLFLPFGRKRRTQRRKQLRGKGALPVEQALQIFLAALEGLDLLHKSGIVHRDIKPDNIMFRQLPQHGRAVADDDVVLIDLGIAAREGGMSRAGLSEHWAEPARIKAKKEKQRLEVRKGFDIYSMGMMLRFMLTYQSPRDYKDAHFKREITPKELRFRTRLKTDEKKSVAQQLTTLVQSCLVDEADRRPSTRELMYSTEKLILTLPALRKPKRRRGLFATAGLAACAAAFSAVLYVNSLGFNTIDFSPFLEVPNALEESFRKALGATGLATPLHRATPSPLLSPTEEVATDTSTIAPDEGATAMPTQTPMPADTATPVIILTATPTVLPTTVKPTSVVPTAAPTATATVVSIAPTVVQCPDGSITLPRTRATVRRMVQVYGTAKHVQFERYKLEYRPRNNKNAEFSHLFESRNPPEGELLGSFDSTGIPNGWIDLRLLVVYKDGNYSPHPCMIALHIQN